MPQANVRSPGSRLPGAEAAARAATPAQPTTPRPAPTTPRSPDPPAADARDGKDPARLTQDVPTARDLVPATRLYAGDILASPLGRATAAELAGAEAEERIVQLCNFEAVEQIRRAKPRLRAEHVVAQARSLARITGLRVEAPGAAVQGRGRWHALAYVCEVRPDLAGVAAFAHALKGEIPPRAAEELGLPTDPPAH